MSLNKFIEELYRIIADNIDNLSCDEMAMWLGDTNDIYMEFDNGTKLKLKVEEV